MPLTRIKLRRLERDLPQVVVATRAGIPRQRMSEIECGYVQPRAEELVRLADVLGVSVNALTNEERAG